MQNSQTGIKPLSYYVTDLQSGSRPKGGVRGIETGIPSVGGEHLNSYGGFDFSSIRFVSPDFADGMTKGKITRNDILIVKDGATTGKVSFVDNSFPYNDATINEHVFILRTNKKIIPKFLFWHLWCKNGQIEILKNFQGSAQGGINRSFLEGVNVPDLPIEYQEEVAKKLDSYLSQCWLDQTRLKKTRNLISKFRQSILSAAVAGKLTEEWRKKNPSVETASLLLKKIIAEKIKIKKKNKTQANVFDTNHLLDLPLSWVFTTLGQVVIDFKYGTSEKSDYAFTGTPVLRIPNIVSGSLDLTDLKYLSTSTTNEDDFVRNRDILIVRSNGSRDLVGKNALVENVKNNIAYASYLIKIRPLIVNSTYIWILLNSPLAKKQLFDQAKSAAGINNINTQELSSLTIPLPPLEEQQEIVKRVKSMFDAADLVDKQIEVAGNKSDKLTQSILAKAFRGEL
mgnify:CR=1 FL=1